MNEFQIKAIQFAGDAESANRIRVQDGVITRLEAKVVNKQVCFSMRENRLTAQHDPDGCIAKVKHSAFKARYCRKYSKISSPSPESIIYIRNETT